MWSLDSQNTLPNIRLTTPGKASALACSPNGSYAVVAVDHKLYVWQLCNGRLLTNIARHYQTITCLKFNQDGSLFASAAEDGLAFVWSLSSVLNDKDCKPLHSLSDHTLPIKDIYFGRFGYRAKLFTASLDRTVNVYEAITGALLLKLVFDVPLMSITLNVVESELFVGCVDGRIFRFNLHDPPRGIEHHVASENNVYKGHGSSVVCLSVSINCKTFLSGSLDKFVHIWDIASHQILKSIEHKGSITSAFFTKQHIHFQTPHFKPNLIINNLQRVSDESDNNRLEIVTKDKNAFEYLDFSSYVGGVEESNDELLEEIRNLKKINSELYRCTIEHILNEVDDSFVLE